MFELELLKRIAVANKVESKQLYKIFLNLLLLKNETFSQMFLQGSQENLSSYYLSLQKDYLTFLSQYFIKKGNKNKVENMFRKFFLKLKKRKNLSRRWAKKTWRSFLKCKYNAMYYIRLKIRKRRRRVKYRVTYLESYRWLKKSVLPLAKTVKESKLRTFSDAFFKEFLLLRSGKSGITSKRNEYHKLAYMRAPYSWKRERKFKQTRQKGATWRFFKVWNRKIRKLKWSVWLKKTSGRFYSNRVNGLKKVVVKRHFNKWVSQYLLNQEIFHQAGQNPNKVEKSNKNNSAKKFIKSSSFIDTKFEAKKSSQFLFKKIKNLHKFFIEGNSYFAKVRLFLSRQNKQENKFVLAQVKFPVSNFEHKKNDLILKNRIITKSKLSSNLIFGKNISNREKFVKKYLLPKKGNYKIDLAKPYPLLNSRFLKLTLIKRRIKSKRIISFADKKFSLLEKNMYIRKFKKLNAFNFSKYKGSNLVSISSLVSKPVNEIYTNFKFLKPILKGSAFNKVDPIFNAGKNLKQKSNYDHCFKTLSFFSVVLVWKFLESRLLKNLTLNEYKKIEKDLWRKKKYQFIKKMFYYIKMLYRDLYKI